MSFPSSAAESIPIEIRVTTRANQILFLKNLIRELWADEKKTEKTETGRTYKMKRQKPQKTEYADTKPKEKNKMSRKSGDW